MANDINYNVYLDENNTYKALFELIIKHQKA